MTDTETTAGSEVVHPKAQLQHLQEVCSITFEQSFENGRDLKIAAVMQFSTDLAVWVEVLGDRPETRLYSDANKELVVALLNLAQGEYRNAFKGLRLILELFLQGVYLSANLLELEEWLSNDGHTNWSKLINEDDGPLGNRFCRAFFPELKGHRKAMLAMAATLYTELSETIHGNVPSRIPLPESMEFCEDAFVLWCEKFETVQLIIHFNMSLRYLVSMDELSRDRLVDILNDQLGHLTEVRVLLGGVETV